MTLTIVRETQTFDEWGNPVVTTTEENYEIELRDFQPYARGGLAEQIEINDDGTFKHRYRKLFLRDALKDISVDVGQIVKVDGKQYRVVEFQEYERHKEAILHVVE